MSFKIPSRDFPEDCRSPTAENNSSRAFVLPILGQKIAGQVGLVGVECTYALPTDLGVGYWIYREMDFRCQTKNPRKKKTINETVTIDNKILLSLNFL